MANKFVKCADCKGNMWPDGQQLREHKHLPELERRTVLKLKYRAGQRGWSKPANPRTNSPQSKGGKWVIQPRRRAYGPF